MKKTLLILLFSILAVSLIFSEGSTEKKVDQYPTKGIDIIVSVSAGGTPDVLTRVAAEWLSNYWKKPVTVINKPGGGAIPGALEVLNAPADGYTVGTITSQNSSQQHGANKNPPIDVNKPTYVARVFDVDLVLTVNAKSEWNDIKSFSKWAVENPDKLVWACTGAVSTASFATAEWYAKIGGDIRKTRMITTAGGSESALQLAAGNCVMNFGDFLGSAPMVQAGKVRYLATSAKQRNPYFPDVPTMEENGIKGLTVSMWVGFMMPNGVPDTVVKAWNDAIQKMIVDQEFLKKLSNVAGRTAYLNSTDFRKLILEECATYTTLAENLGIRK
ncbi:MAG: tripartite tricarboxylate transporter substrate binding protein [Spirochaetales bacterium]|nr:tripartite tricarboxylate transporter substrate binding protein [Spirochaetales bacterium]